MKSPDFYFKGAERSSEQEWLIDWEVESSQDNMCVSVFMWRLPEGKVECEDLRDGIMYVVLFVEEYSVVLC